MKERELLERALDALNQIWDYGLENFPQSTHEELMDEIKEFLATPEPKPIAYWNTQEGTLTPAVPLSSERTCFKVPLVPLYLHPRADIADELVEALEELMYARTDKAERMALAALKKLEEK